MNVIEFNKPIISTPGAGRSVKFAMTDLVANFLRLQIFGQTNVIKLNPFEDSDNSTNEVSGNAKLNDQHKEVLTKLLNHLAHDTELKLTQTDLDTFDEAEKALRPKLKSNENLIMFYLYLLCRCSFDSASNEVLKVWRDYLDNFVALL